jgi:hypothetical protein
MEKFVQDTPTPLQHFLRAFASWDLGGEPSVSIEALETLPPLQMCVEFLLLLANGADVALLAPMLIRHEFLWPSALTWAIATGEPRARALLAPKPPNVPFINDLFYHASVCVSKRPSPWLLLLDRPDFRLLRRFCPGSINAIHFFLASDIAALVTIVTVAQKPSTRIVFSWRAWVAGFGLEEFVRTLLYVLIWNIQVCTDPLSAMTFFKCAACLMVVVCEGNEDMLRMAICTAVDVVENADCGIGVNGDGLAEFCLILTVAMRKAKDMFGDLLEHRRRLVDQAPPTGTAKLGFCVSLIKGALYVPSLRGLIEPQIFGTPMMRQEWQAAIDYFIAVKE